MKHEEIDRIGDEYVAINELGVLVLRSRETYSEYPVKGVTAGLKFVVGIPLKEKRK